MQFHREKKKKKKQANRKRLKISQIKKSSKGHACDSHKQQSC